MESYENLPEIAAVPGVDVIMVGPLDLSATVGSMGDTRAPAVLEIMEDVPKILEGTGVACATTLVPYEHHELAVQWGYGPPTRPSTRIFRAQTALPHHHPFASLETVVELGGVVQAC